MRQTEIAENSNTRTRRPPTLVRTRCPTDTYTYCTATGKKLAVCVILFLLSTFGQASKRNTKKRPKCATSRDPSVRKHLNRGKTAYKREFCTDLTEIWSRINAPNINRRELQHKNAPPANSCAHKVPHGHLYLLHSNWEKTCCVRDFISTFDFRTSLQAKHQKTAEMCYFP